MNENFLKAFNHAMIFEVGAFWDPKDPEVIAGLIETKQQRKKVGYVNIKQDNGGETKYGVAKNANPELNITTLDLIGAQQVFFDKYWLAGKCDKLSDVLALIHFDGCCNHGVGRASKFLQTAAGVTADGVIGPASLKAVLEKNEKELIESIADLRTNFYNAIVSRNPSQKMFLAGWLRRISEVKAFCLSQIK